MVERKRERKRETLMFYGRVETSCAMFEGWNGELAEFGGRVGDRDDNVVERTRVRGGQRTSVLQELLVFETRI